MVKNEYLLIPEYTMESIIAYVESGRPTGDFLQAVIQNNLRMAVAHADEENIKHLPSIVRYFYNRCPSGCWGNVDAFHQWIKKGGLKGRKN